MNLGYMKLDGDCILSGTIAQPSFTGEVLLTEGYVYYLDRRFTIQRATLNNYNPRELDPVIDLEAQTDVAAVSGDQMETYTIILTLKGNVNNPQITLKEKTGVLNELELFSILTFGQPIGGVSGDARERVKEFIGRSIVGFGTRRVEKMLGVEKLEIQGDLFGGKQAVKNTRVTIAKKVSPRLMVLYETDIGQLNRPKLSALYRITDRFYFSGERNSEGDAGLDLIFKYSR